MKGFRIKIFADGADIGKMKEIESRGYVSGFTTNPSLAKKAGITDYLGFAQEASRMFPDKPLSLEVISDEGEAMEAEARRLAALGGNIMVKIPIVSSRGASSIRSIQKLSSEGIRLNVTAVFTIRQVKEILSVLPRSGNHYISIFAGRIADTGRDAVKTVREAVELCKDRPEIEILWASCREVYNIIEADQAGCHIITVTNDILKKLDLLGKDLDEYSRETAAMFYNDSVKAGFKIL